MHQNNQGQGCDCQMKAHKTAKECEAEIKWYGEHVKMSSESLAHFVGS